MKQFNELKFLFFLILFFVSINLFAQKGYNDIVYLKNGSVIHGLVMEVKSDQSVKIQTRDKNIFVFKLEEVDRIEFGAAKNNSEKNPSVPIDSKLYSGICMGVEASIGTGIGTYQKNIQGTFGAHFLFGYMYNSIFMIGAKAGFNVWNLSYDFENSALPFDFDIVLRLFPMRTKISPLLIADAGIAAGPEQLSEDYSRWGPTYNLGAGIRINETSKRGYTIAVCYRNQMLNKYSYSYSGSQFQNKLLESICLEVGISF